MTTKASSATPTAVNGTQLSLVAIIRAKRGLGDELVGALVNEAKPGTPGESLSRLVDLAIGTGGILEKDENLPENSYQIVVLKNKTPTRQ